MFIDDCVLESPLKLYEHKLENVIKNNQDRIMYDNTILGNLLINAWTPDIVVVDEKERRKKPRSQILTYIEMDDLMIKNEKRLRNKIPYKKKSGCTNVGDEEIKCHLKCCRGIGGLNNQDGEIYWRNFELTSGLNNATKILEIGN